MYDDYDVSKQCVMTDNCAQLPNLLHSGRSDKSASKPQSRKYMSSLETGVNHGRT